MVVYDYWYDNIANGQTVPAGIRVYDYNNEMIPFLDMVPVIIICSKTNPVLIIPSNVICSTLKIHDYNINSTLILPPTVRSIIFENCNINKLSIQGSLHHIKCLNSNITHCIIPNDLISLYLQGSCVNITGPWPQDKLILDLNGECDIIPYYTKHVCRHIFVSYDMIKHVNWNAGHHSITLIPGDKDDKPDWPLNGSFLEHPDSDWLWPYVFGPLYNQGVNIMDDSVELLKDKNIIQTIKHLGYVYHFHDPHYVIIPIIWDHEYLTKIQCPCPDWKFDNHAEYVFFGHWMYDPVLKIIVKFIVSSNL